MVGVSTVAGINLHTEGEEYRAGSGQNYGRGMGEMKSGKTEFAATL